MLFRRCVCLLLLFIAVFCFAAPVYAAPAEEPPFTAVISVPGLGDAEIPLQHTESGDYLFLPACAELDALVLRFSGKNAVLTGDRGSLEVESGAPFSVFSLLASGQQSCDLTFVSGNIEVGFTLMHSLSMRTAYLSSGDPRYGRSYVEADKDRKVKGVSFALLRPDGSAVWSGPLKNIKGRGNSTWHYVKKPYQIKLSEKADLLETGDKTEKETTWILLANYIDESLLRNQISFDLAAEYQLPYTPHCISVDLFYDGEYRGVYLLCEKTEISKGRVSIRNLEKEIENENPEIKDYEDLSWAQNTLEGGLSYRYYPALKAPEDIRGGYLLELDYGPRAKSEASWFCTENGQYVTVKSPEYMPDEAMRYIASLYQRFERAVMSGGIDPETGEDYRDLCDLDSLARCFLLMELAKDNDAFLSSTYFYKPEGEEKLFAGPVWDFDTGYGVAELPENISVANRTILGNRLLCIPSFREALISCWGELKPLVQDILLSDDPRTSGTRLRSLVYYNLSTSAARRMDRALWGRDAQDMSVADLRSFLIRRTGWLDEQIDAWSAGVIPDRLFQDVNEEQWFYPAVEYSVEQGLFSGMSAIQFEPYRSVTRAMAVAVLHRMVGEPKAESSCGYKDVDPDSWYAEAVNWAAEAGITSGIGKNRFAPSGILTREQLITMLFRTIQYAGIDTTGRADISAFSDSARISPWALEAMAWAVDSGVIQGNDNRLEPQGKANRAQAAAIISRVHQICFQPENSD